MSDAISEALARREDTTGLCTVRDLTAAVVNSGIKDAHGRPCCEMFFEHKGHRYNVELAVTCIDACPTGTDRQAWRYWFKRR